MLHTKIVIKRKGDTPDIDNSNKVIITGDITQLTIYEGGMASGKTSIALYIDLPDGTKVISYTSAEMLKGLVAALEGAEKRFLDEKV